MKFSLGPAFGDKRVRRERENQDRKELFERRLSVTSSDTEIKQDREVAIGQSQVVIAGQAGVTVGGDGVVLLGTGLRVKKEALVS